MDACALISRDPSVCFGRQGKLVWGITISCHMQSFMAIHALGEKFCALQVFEIPDFVEFLRFCFIFARVIKISLGFFARFCTNMRMSRICGWTSLLYEVPGGNQVDGLPPVASTRAGYRDARLGRNICGVNGRLCADFSRFLCLFWASPEN